MVRASTRRRRLGHASAGSHSSTSVYTPAQAGPNGTVHTVRPARTPHTDHTLHKHSMSTMAASQWRKH